MPICPTCLQHFPDDTTSCPTDGVPLAPDAAFAYVDRELQAGDKVGEYQIEGKLGEGGFGAVYRAVHPVIGKTAAVKVLNRQFSSHPQMVSRFIAEARAVNQIRHKNIIDIFAFGQLADGRQYYVMELLDGMPFDKYLEDQKRLGVAQAMPILRAIARAVDAAHAKGILHRDLKPENVYLVFDDDGGVSPKLLDFGLVKLLGVESGNHKTKTGTPLGTPYYMSPEQVRGKDTDARTDVYAFGAMMFEVFTGRVPFEGESAMDILLKHLDEEVPRASELAADLPPAIDDVLRTVMAKEARDRPASLGEALDRVGAAAGLETANPVPSHPLPRPAPHATPPASAPQAHAQTFLASEADVAVPPKPRGSRVPMVLGAVVVVAACGIAAMLLGRAPAARPTTGGLVASTAAPASASASAAPALASAAPVALPANVTVRVDGAPAGARVTIGGKDAGAAPGPFAVARDVPVTLVVTAKGYKSREIPLTPSKDTSVDADLEREKAPIQKHGPSISGDLEGFDKKP